MHQPPQPVGEGVLTPRMWRGILFVGMIMAAGTLFVLDASLPGGFVDGSGDLRYAQTMSFTTLMLFQIVNVMNARSDQPFLQHAFGTVALSGGDWLRCIAVASSVLWLRKLSKLFTRAMASRTSSRHASAASLAAS